MAIDIDSRIYYKQYDMEYEVEGRGGSTVKADRLKLNLYFDASQRAEQLTQIDINIKIQRDALKAIQADNEKT